MRNRLAALLVVLLSVVVYWSSLYKPNKVTLPRTLEDWEAHADEFIHPPGKFINLSQASVHYILEGPASADLVVLVHGLHENLLMWDRMRKDILDAGYRVLSFDNYGNAWSEAPTAEYNERLYVGQLAELLFALNITEPVHLIGQSLGGAISSTFSTVYPGKVKSLQVMGPAGLGVKTPFVANFIKIPIIGEILIRFFGYSHIWQRGPGAYQDPKYVKLREEALKLLKYQLDHNKGLFPTLLSIMRSFRHHDISDVWEAVGDLKFPVHVIFGEKDKTVHASNAAILKAFIPRAEVSIVPNLGHMAFYQGPEIINPLLITFIKKSELGGKQQAA